MERSESVLRKAAIRKEEIRNKYKLSIVSTSDLQQRENFRDLFEEEMNREFPKHGKWMLELQEEQDLIDYKNSVISSGTNQPEMDLVSQIVELEDLKNKNHGN